MKLFNFNKANLKKYIIGDLSIRRFVRSLLLIYLFLNIYVFFVSDSMMFLPHPPFYDESEQIIKLSTNDGQEIAAKYINNNEARYTILYSHGNSEDIDDISPILNDFVSQGFSVISYDYPGYGLSEGKPTEKGTYSAIESVYQFLIEKNNTHSTDIIAVGFSLGNGPTTYLAENHDLGGVILQAPFITAFRVVTHIPILPFDKFKNLDRIKNIKESLLIIHGTDDEVIPFWHGEKLYEVANDPKMYYWVDGAGHFNITDVAGEDYWKSIHKFLSNL